MERTKIYRETRLVSKTDIRGLEDAAKHLAGGEVVGFPTETVYGLGANAFDEEAVDRIFKAKGRPGDNPLIVHIYSKEQIPELVSEITPNAQKLMDAFMPGPITVIMKKSDRIPSNVTAGLDTVGIRMPSHETANQFLKLCGCPVAAPSANLSGSPSPTRAEHVMDDMNGYVYAVVDGGESNVGLESTVVDCSGEQPVVLRPGAITKAMIDSVCGTDSDTKLTAEKGETPKAPGMKYRHYAPNAPVEIIMLPEGTGIINDEGGESSDFEFDSEKLNEEDSKRYYNLTAPYLTRVSEMLKENPFARIGLFCGGEVKALLQKLDDKVILSHCHFYTYGRAADVSAASHCLFDGMRLLDIQGVDLILAAGFDGAGLSKAYMNRLGKAALRTGETTPEMNTGKKTLRGERDLDSFSDVETMSVLFVCRSNRTLSAACEGILTSIINREQPFASVNDAGIGIELYADSAGMYAMEGESPNEMMVKAVKDAAGVNIGHHKTRRVTVSMIDNSDLILTARDDDAYEIVKSFPEIKNKVFSLSSFAASRGLVFKDDKGRVAGVSIPDPEGENQETFNHTAKALKAWIELLFPYILGEIEAQRI